MGFFSKETPEEKADKLGQKLWKILASHSLYDVSDKKLRKIINAGANVDYQENNKSILDHMVRHLGKTSYVMRENWFGLAINQMKDINKVSGEAILIALLKQHRDIHSYYKSEYTSLVDSILQKNPDLNFQSSGSKETALMVAISQGATEVAEKILAKDPDIHLQNRQGNNALMLSIIHGHGAISEEILAKSPKLDQVNKDGNTALMLCFIHERFELAHRILKNNIDVNVSNNKKETALLLALKHNQEGIASAILEKGADPSVSSNEGDVFYFARTENTRLLLKEKIAAFKKENAAGDPDMVVLTTKVDAVMTLTEIFNFKKMECISFIQREGDPPSAPSHRLFERMQDFPSLQEAFAQHCKMGGTTGADAVFPARKISLPLNRAPNN